MNNNWKQSNEKRKAEELRQSMIKAEQQKRKFSKATELQLDIYGNETVKELNHQKEIIAKKYINNSKGKSNRHQKHEQKYAISIAKQLGYKTKEELWWNKVEERCKLEEEHHAYKIAEEIIDNIIKTIERIEQIPTKPPKIPKTPRKRQRSEKEKELWREKVTRWKMTQEDINIL